MCTIIIITTLLCVCVSRSDGCDVCVCVCLHSAYISGIYSRPRLPGQVYTVHALQDRECSGCCLHCVEGMPEALYIPMLHATMVEFEPCPLQTFDGIVL